MGVHELSEDTYKLAIKLAVHKSQESVWSLPTLYPRVC